MLNYELLLKYYDEHKHKPVSEWLEIKTIFKKSGKQGVVGLAENKIDRDKYTLVYVFKISQQLDFLIRHEINVMNSTNIVASYCPNFVKSIGGVIIPTNPFNKENPFDLTGAKYTVEKDMLLMEYIPDSHNLYTYIKTATISKAILFSAVKQVLASICVGQTKLLTHYDLHSNNILMTKCDSDLVYIYKLKSGTFCVPTYGRKANIIDFGYAYSESCKGSNMWQSLSFTDTGFNSYKYSETFDTRLFLCCVSNELSRYRGSKKLIDIVEHNYKHLNIDVFSGWDKGIKNNMNDYILDKLKKYGKYSKLFVEWEYYCIDLMNSLVRLPFKKSNSKHFELSFCTFLTEFIKIENEIGSLYFGLFLLREIVDITNTVYNDYKNKETRASAVAYFKQSILERVDSVAKYVRLKTLNYEKMLCALVCFTECLSGELYTLQKSLKKKEKIPLKHTEDVLLYIDSQIKEKYVFNNQTKFVIINTLDMSMNDVDIDESWISELNNIPSMYWGQKFDELFLLS